MGEELLYKGRGLVQMCPFDKGMTNSIKGMLLILMFILHFFCFPSWYMEKFFSNRYVFMEQFQGHFQICVAGFAFLTGYLYYYSKKKSIKYIFKKWLDLLIPYWLVLSLFILIAVVLGISSIFTVGVIVKELLGVDSVIMSFNWYVPFYIIMLPTLILSANYIKNDYIMFGAGLLFPMILYYSFVYFFSGSLLDGTLSKFSVYFPITICGYLSSKNRVFEKLCNIFSNNTIRVIVSIVSVVVVFYEPSWLYAVSVDNIIMQFIRKLIRVISISLFMWGVWGLLKKMKDYKKCQWIVTILSRLGSNSLIMWFLHGMFFNCFKEYLQPIFFRFRSPMIGMIIGLIFCYYMALPINRVSSIIRQRIKV